MRILAWPAGPAALMTEEAASIMATAVPMTAEAARARPALRSVPRNAERATLDLRVSPNAVTVPDRPSAYSRRPDSSSSNSPLRTPAMNARHFWGV